MSLNRVLRRLAALARARGPNADAPPAQAPDLPGLILDRTHVCQLLAKTSEGLFAFDPRDREVGWRIAFEGSWEDTETDFIKGIVGAGDTVIDVGANLGWYTVLLAKLVGEGGSVIAFEPNPRNYELLSENLRLNKVTDRVTAHPVALLDARTSVAFELSESNFGDHRVRFGASASPAGEPEQHAESSRPVITVAGTTLDEVLGKESEYAGGRRIRLIKIDCQGSEVAILRGARQALAATDYLVSEFWPYGIRRAGFEPEEFFEIMEKHFAGFRRVRGGGDGGEFKPISMLAADARTVVKFTDYAFKGRGTGAAW